MAAEQAFINSSFFTWVVMPFLIFLARTLDVALGTLRILLLNRGKRFISPILGFLEMLVWLLAVRQVIVNMANIGCFFAFAAGFAFGNYVGMMIEEKLAIGLEVFRIITKKDDAGRLIDALKAKGYGVTWLNAHGSTGEVNIIFSVVNRRDHDIMIRVIHEVNPKAFYSIEDIRAVSEGVFPSRKYIQIKR